MNEKSRAENACEFTKVKIKERNIAYGGRRARFECVGSICESINSIGYIEENDHEDEKHTKGVEFNKERDIAF